MAPAWSSPSSFSFASTLPQGGVARQASPPSPEPHPKVPRAPAAESATRAEAGGVGPGNQPVDWAGGAPRGPPCAATAWPADQDLARRPCKRPRPPSSALARPGQGASAAGRRWRVSSRHQWPRIKKDPAKAGSCRRQKPSPCMARTTNSAKPMAPGRPQAWALALMRRLSLRLKPKAMPAPSKGRGPGTLSWV